MADYVDPVLESLPPAQNAAEKRAQQTIASTMQALAQAALPTVSPKAAPSSTQKPAKRKPHARKALPPTQAPRPAPRPTYRPLAPAPAPAPIEEERASLTIFDLPAELRVEIYKLVLENVIIHILPLSDNLSRNCPHALIRTSRQVRNEVLPIIHSQCRIRTNVTDFDFGGMLAWIGRIPPDQQASLCKNQDLRIVLCTTQVKPNVLGNEMRKWLKMRADPYRPQPGWKYSGAQAQKPVASDLRRRVKRMTEPGKREELEKMLEAINVHVNGPRGRP